MNTSPVSPYNPAITVQPIDLGTRPKDCQNGTLQGQYPTINGPATPLESRLVTASPDNNGEQSLTFNSKEDVISAVKRWQAQQKVATKKTPTEDDSVECMLGQGISCYTDVMNLFFDLRTSEKQTACMDKANTIFTLETAKYLSATVIAYFHVIHGRDPDLLREVEKILNHDTISRASQIFASIGKKITSHKQFIETLAKLQQGKITSALILLGSLLFGNILNIASLTLSYKEFLRLLKPAFDKAVAGKNTAWIFVLNDLKLGKLLCPQKKKNWLTIKQCEALPAPLAEQYQAHLNQYHCQSEEVPHSKEAEQLSKKKLIELINQITEEYIGSAFGQLSQYFSIVPDTSEASSSPTTR